MRHIWIYVDNILFFPISVIHIRIPSYSSNRILTQWSFKKIIYSLNFLRDTFYQN